MIHERFLPYQNFYVRFRNYQFKLFDSINNFLNSSPFRQNMFIENMFHDKYNSKFEFVKIDDSLYFHNYIIHFSLNYIEFSFLSFDLALSFCSEMHTTHIIWILLSKLSSIQIPPRFHIIRIFLSKLYTNKTWILLSSPDELNENVFWQYDLYNQIFVLVLIGKTLQLVRLISPPNEIDGMVIRREKLYRSKIILVLVGRASTWMFSVRK